MFDRLKCQTYMKTYFHLFANGDDARNFITSEEDFRTAFNHIGVCAFVTGVTVVSFSIEDSHPHVLLWCEECECINFRDLYQSMSLRSIIQRRGSKEGVNLIIEYDKVADESYLMNVAVYTIIQPTKDGKAVLPFDYLYGSGALYFRTKNAMLPWQINEDGQTLAPCKFGTLNYREQKLICSSTYRIPDEWLVCNGFILPTNYVDIKRFENIYKTHNCYRVFLGHNKKQDEAILLRMANARGINIEDIEARKLCLEECKNLYNKKSTRTLDTTERIKLAMTLRRKYQLSGRQLSLLIKIPELELNKYLK